MRSRIKQRNKTTKMELPFLIFSSLCCKKVQVGLQESFPEVETATRLSDLGRQIISYHPVQGNPKRFEENNGFLADPSVFFLFDLEFISGEPQTALNNPNTAVLTSSIAKKYFADEDPIGKTLMNESRKQPLQVTGVIKDLPGNTHLRIDYLVSMPTFVIYTGYKAFSFRL